MRKVNYLNHYDVAEESEHVDLNRFKHHDDIFKKRTRYSGIIITFDIETTSFPEDGLALMYHWQMCIDGQLIYGRTWEQWLDFMERLDEFMNGRKYVVWVHNLSFEFQFFRTFVHIDDIFAKDPRDVVKCVVGNCEFRCSYALSNMGLAKLAETTPNVHTQKLAGQYDYRKIRWPDTELDDLEFAYCMADVASLYEIIKEYLEHDNYISLPMTSTGFVRRDYREACRVSKEHIRRFQRCKLNVHQYHLCKEAARGGVSGSNPLYTDEIVYGCDSYDIKSSYPYAMMTQYFPDSAFMSAPVDKVEEMSEFCCCLIDITFHNIVLYKWEAIPYISLSRCKVARGYRVGNGKIFLARELRMTITEIDFEIIKKQYKFSDYEVHELQVAQRGMLSTAFRQVLLNWFKTKEEIGKTGDQYLYLKTKNKINASFGMMLTDICMPDVIYVNGADECWYRGDTNEEKLLDRYYYSKQSFLNYQDGVWVTAHARKRLYEPLLNGVDDNVIQCDTDSVKGVHLDPEIFERINKKIIREADTFDVPPYVEVDGKRTYLGVWEHDAKYKAFRTLGAKKYAYTDDKGLHITVAGLNKKSGAKYLEEHGGLRKFVAGVEIPPPWSGRTSSKYHDVAEPFYYHGWLTGSSICIEDVSYTLGMTDEWIDMIEEVRW